MKQNKKSLYCSRCGAVFFADDIQYTSSLYGSGPDILLCSSCHKLEEERIQECGTNDIPTILNSYVPCNKKHSENTLQAWSDIIMNRKD